MAGAPLERSEEHEFLAVFFALFDALKHTFNALPQGAVEQILLANAHMLRLTLDRTPIGLTKRRTSDGQSRCFSHCLLGSRHGSAFLLAHALEEIAGLDAEYIAERL